MMKILKIIKIDYRDRKIIRELYKHQTTSIKTKESKREATIKKGVRQGCKLPPLLFNMYIEQAINEFKEYCTGINPLNAELNPICHLLALLGAHHILHVSRIRVKVNGMRMQMLKFADDIAIIAQDEINLKRALESLGDILKVTAK